MHSTPASWITYRMPILAGGDKGAKGDTPPPRFHVERYLFPNGLMATERIRRGSMLTQHWEDESWGRANVEIARLIDGRNILAYTHKEFKTNN